MSWKLIPRPLVDRSSLDLSAIQPDRFRDLDVDAVARVRLGLGNEPIELGECFDIEGAGGDDFVEIAGSVKTSIYLGIGMKSGILRVSGDCGRLTGVEAEGGTIDVAGSVGFGAGSAMRGGLLRVQGDAGSGLGGAYPGRSIGMRDGTILVAGSAGDDVGLAMRRGLIAIGGSAGAGTGRSMIAGSIFVAGTVAKGTGAGMKRGTIVLMDENTLIDEAVSPTFAATGRFRPHFLAIYLRRLDELGFAVDPRLFGCECERYNGDLIERGIGEILVCNPYSVT